MDNIFFYIHHLPCSYRCGPTINYAKRVEAAIQKVEPEFIEKTKNLLKKPLLVFGERNFVIFDGRISGNKLYYNDCHYFSNPARIENNIDFFDSIKNGDSIEISKRFLSVMKDSDSLTTVPSKEEWFLIDFD